MRRKVGLESAANQGSAGCGLVADPWIRTLKPFSLTEGPTLAACCSQTPLLPSKLSPPHHPASSRPHSCLGPSGEPPCPTARPAPQGALGAGWHRTHLTLDAISCYELAVAHVVHFTFFFFDQSRSLTKQAYSVYVAVLTRECLTRASCEQGATTCSSAPHAWTRECLTGAPCGHMHPFPFTRTSCNRG